MAKLFKGLGKNKSATKTDEPVKADPPVEEKKQEEKAELIGDKPSVEQMKEEVKGPEVKQEPEKKRSIQNKHN